MNVLLSSNNNEELIKWGNVIKNEGHQPIVLDDDLYDIKNNSLIDNARLRAQYYFYKSGLMTVYIDYSFYINGLNREEQLFLLRNMQARKNLNYNDQYQYIADSIKRLGGYTVGYVEEIMVIMKNDKDVYTRAFITKKEFKLPPSKTKREENPLESFIYDSETGKFNSQLSKMEINRMESDVFVKQKRFLTQSL